MLLAAMKGCSLQVPRPQNPNLNLSVTALSFAWIRTYWLQPPAVCVMLTGGGGKVQRLSP